MSKKVIVTIVMVSMFTFTAGFISGIFTTTPLAGEMYDMRSAYDRITYLSDAEINSLLTSMNPDILSRTLEELADSNSAKALVATYLCNDPSFEEVLCNY